jgi:hypothetical protein
MGGQHMLSFLFPINKKEKEVAVKAESICPGR